LVFDGGGCSRRRKKNKNTRDPIKSDEAVETSETKFGREKVETSETKFGREKGIWGVLEVLPESSILGQYTPVASAIQPPTGADNK
jgi:hypothetical protein